MGKEDEFAEQFNATYDKLKFFFHLPVVDDQTHVSPDYVSNQFTLIPQKIDKMFLESKSIKDYLLHYANINNQNLIETRELNEISSGTSGGISFFLSGKTPAPLQTSDTDTSLKISTEKILVAPLTDEISIEDRAIELYPVQFAAYCEQLIINFGIELCIAISEHIEKHRSSFSDRCTLEALEYSANSVNHFIDFKKDKDLKRASKEQSKRIFPKAWDLFCDNQKLFKMLRLINDNLKIAIQLEPYFLQSKTFHNLLSSVAIPSNSRQKELENFFDRNTFPTLPSPSLREISRTLILLRTFNTHLFEDTHKLEEIVIPALQRSKLPINKFESSTLRSAYFATMRNS